MNSKIEMQIALMRCQNKPVKQIAKKLGINKEDIEAVIKKWIVYTDKYLENLIKNRKIKNNKVDPGLVLNMIQNTEELLKNDDILDYISLHRTDYHDRYMDCIRYKVYMYLKEKENK
ncbi:hypothetical protein DFR86_09345 [Acidianus sulfidivorans JP7]|uniref:Uncharacterized protein n=1 Tax=Acidianus sulfidivorans JP7 TaxID=619593 RepID=A0A2U9INV7_9CREN|nr:hypothetical protein [Acidianus sulfidivorans]AWR97729.1 hypothetical protein DFR86_09345 [Acidianus sulfidivorans JP7]